MRSSNPNIIIIVADDLGYGDVGVYGNPIVNTPNIDLLANRGVILTQHYSASPMCAPARAGLLTGRFPHRTGAVDVPSNRGLDRISLSEKTIADVLKSSGYATGMVGKWHNGAHDLRYHPNDRGFDEFVGFLNGGMDYWKWVLDSNKSPVKSDGRYLTDVLSEEATSFIDRHAKEPFFLYVGFNAPHMPLQAPPKLIEKYSTTGELTNAVSTIYSMVEQMDAGIGSIVDSVQRNGLEDNTIILFTSDNGPVVGGNGEDNLDRYNGGLSGSKGEVLEGGIRVPGIISWPAGIPPGQTIDGMVHFCDWMPTLTTFSGSEIPENIDGRDISSLLTKGYQEEDFIRFWQWNRYEPVSRANGAMRDGPWKLYWPSVPEAIIKDPEDTKLYQTGLTKAHQIMDINISMTERNLVQKRSPVLYNVESDLPEWSDLSDYHPDRVATMTSAWDSWFSEMLAEWHVSRNLITSTTRS